jgi:hypothetical protein
MIYLNKSKIYLKIIAMQIFLLLTSLTMSQLPMDMVWVRFGPDFRFKDGIYANFEMVRTNCPIPPARVVTDLTYLDKDFYKKVLSGESLVLHDDQGVKVIVESRNIWGYAYMGRMYLQIGGRFHRLLPEGILSRFIASATVWESIVPSRVGPPGYLAYSTSSNYYSPVYFEVARRNEVLLLDFEDNIMISFNPEALQSQLEKDSVLYREYESLGKHKRKKRILEYVKRYNQRHPIYFPVVSID